LEIPSGGGVGTARGVARAYSAFARGGELGLAAETLRLLAAPAKPAEHGFYDECMKDEARFSLGFFRPGNTWHFGSWASFGSPGAGGSMGFADPTFGIGYGYVTSRGGTSLVGDPRDVALSNALYASIGG
jgi:CubicO group peptidase (beta-lactamase class C family)